MIREPGTMKSRYLEVTFRQGKAVAAYLYLPRSPDDRSVRTERFADGLLVDYAADGRAIGIEITAPQQTTLDALNRVLDSIHAAPASADELEPLAAA
jgi:uncharacterized protein YuzE